MTDPIVIAGAGEAGLNVALTVRDLGFAGRVVLVGEEAHPPYQRPPLSKGLLAGTVDAVELELRDGTYLRDRGIELITGRRVVDGELTDAGGRVTLDDGTQLGFSGLALATGAEPRPLPGGDTVGVHQLRTVPDALALKTALAGAEDVVVVGGGFIGLEVAATARAHGPRVTVVEAGDRLLGRVVAQPVSSHVQRFHEEGGTRVLLSTSVSALRTDAGRVTGVELSDGRGLPADVVVVGIGARPRVDLAEALGLPVDGGVVTDAAGRTAHARVVAVGDCAAQPHPHRAGRLTVESVNNASDQARAAGAALLGLEPGPRGVPWFWSNQGTLKLQMAGISDGYDEHVVRGDGSDGRLTVLYYRHGRLIAADVAGSPRDFNAVRDALALGATIDPEAARSGDAPLKSLVTLPDLTSTAGSRPAPHGPGPRRGPGAARAAR